MSKANANTKLQTNRLALSPIDVAEQSQAGHRAERLSIQWIATARKSYQLDSPKKYESALIKAIASEPIQTNSEVRNDAIAVPTIASADTIIGIFSKQPGHVHAGFDRQISIQFEPNDPGLGTLWGLGSAKGIKADQAWDVTKGAVKNVVGIIDTGIDYAHPDLYKNIFLNQGEIKSLSWFQSIVDIDSDGLISFWDLNDTKNWSGTSNITLHLNDYNINGYIDAGDLLNNNSGWENGLDNDGNGYYDDLIGWDFVENDNDPLDLNGHGTHVSGTIGAMADNTIGVTGVNHKIQMAGLRFLDASGGGLTANAIKATDYFTDLKARGQNSGANFVATNNSWGGGGANTLLSNAISRADSAGILFVAAAGNSSTSTKSYPAAYTQNNVIAVAALTSTGALADYSNFGSTWVDIGAPGTGIYSTLPGGSYGTYSGTSMATPHVTGAAALLATLAPTATAAQIKAALLDGTANGALAGKTVTGDQVDLTVAMTNLNKAIGTKPVATYSLTPSATSLNEGSALTTTVTTSNVQAGTTLYWAFSGAGVSAGDFAAGALTGLGMVGADGKFTFSHTLANDLSKEGDEILTIKLFSDATLGSQLGSSAFVTIKDSSIPAAPVTGQTLWGSNGNDVLTGGSGSDSIAGISKTGKNLGTRQIDTLTGLGGADTFVLADARGSFYSNGNTSSSGIKNYAIIKDFSITDGDRVQVKAGFQYLASFDTSSNATYFYLGNGDMKFSAADELVARLDNINLTPGSGTWVIDSASSLLQMI